MKTVWTGILLTFPRCQLPRSNHASSRRKPRFPIWLGSTQPKVIGAWRSPGVKQFTLNPRFPLALADQEATRGGLARDRLVELLAALEVALSGRHVGRRIDPGRRHQIFPVHIARGSVQAQIACQPPSNRVASRYAGSQSERPSRSWLMCSVRSLVKPAAAKSRPLAGRARRCPKACPRSPPHGAASADRRTAKSGRRGLSSTSGCSAANFSWAASSNVFQRSSGRPGSSARSPPPAPRLRRCRSGRRRGQRGASAREGSDRPWVPPKFRTCRRLASSRPRSQSD